MSMDSDRQHHVLVVCDMQPDLLGSIVPVARRGALEDRIQLCLDVSRRAGWKVIHTGVRFTSSYHDVSPHHKIYGGIRRMNAKLGNDIAHWFLDGYPGSDVTLYEEGDAVVWRSQHLPTQELINEVCGVSMDHDKNNIHNSAAEEVVHATIVGIKAGYAVQAAAQALCDVGVSVQIVRDCVLDDVTARLNTVLDHLLPMYGSVISLAEFIDCAIGLDHYTYKDYCSSKKDNEENGTTAMINALKLYTFCGRSGHAQLYLGHLRANWQPFPSQPWYDEPLTGKQYICPLGKRMVDLSDEPQFSRISMFLKGREWLDEKEKVVDLAEEFMPKTYRLEYGKWIGEEPPSTDSTDDDDDTAASRLWFLKETDKNGGRAVQAFRSPSECFEAADKDSRYVVQPHVANPLLTIHGHKCHLKQYAFLQCSETSGGGGGNVGGRSSTNNLGGIVWDLYTHRDPFLSIAPQPWNSTDVRLDTQVTILRELQLRHDELDNTNSVWSGWPRAYNSCCAILKTVVGRAVEQGKLQSRRRLDPQPSHQQQFELFSADFMMDESGRVWLLEFNFTPVLFDPKNNQELTTKGLVEYDRRYREFEKDDVRIINDHDMIRDALSLALNETLPADTGWELLSTFRSQEEPIFAIPS